MYTLKQFRKSKEWQHFRHNLILKRAKPNGAIICEYCNKPILLKGDIIGHHKIELTEDNVNDKNISLNEENIMLVHLNCHNAIHERFGYEGTKNVYIVWGSVASGKTTYVLNLMKPNDLIIDIDLIYKALNPIAEVKPTKAIGGIALDIWYDLISSGGNIAIRKGNWRRCFIVGCFPSKYEREELADKLNADLIHIDTPREECIKRLYADPNREFNLNEQLQWLNDYWEELVE